MVPYFMVAGHCNYGRYILWHVHEDLSEEAEQPFLHGEHVCRHRDGSWNGVSSDQFGEQTYIRFGKSKGGLVGLSLSPEQVSGWVLSYHICKMLSCYMDNMYEKTDNSKPNIHKEEGMKRRQGDAADRKKLSDELTKYPNPLTGEVRKAANIVNGCVGSDKVNVQDALEMGEKMMVDFAAGLPEGIYKPIKSKLTTLESSKKAVKIGNKSIFDMEKFYGRMLVINQRRKLSLENRFSYELAPVPASLFDEYGRIRKGDKSPLASLVSVAGPVPANIEVVIIDGGMLHHHVTWPTKGTVRSLCAAFAALNDLSTNHDKVLYVIFDKYDPHSIKSNEREKRAHGCPIPQLQTVKGNPASSKGYGHEKYLQQETAHISALYK